LVWAGGSLAGGGPAPTRVGEVPAFAVPEYWGARLCLVSGLYLNIGLSLKMGRVRL